MYSNHDNLVNTLIEDKGNITFDKIISNFVRFNYGRNGRYKIDVNLDNYHTTMWHYNGDEHDLMLTSIIDENLKVLGRELISMRLNEIVKVNKK
jgi:hypothetical protein